MDPQATLFEALSRIAGEDRDGAVESLYALATWLRSGGFFPKVYNEGIGAADEPLCVWRKQ